jgi:hypothetical protein
MLMLPGPSTIPVASADTLPNGLTVTCNQDSDIHSTCVVGGCPRVNGDYVVDALHYKYDSGGSQQEVDFKCINGQTARVASPFNDPSVHFSVQACRKKDLEGDWCTPWAHYDFAPAPKAAPPAAPQPITCPAGSVSTTVIPPAQCQDAPKPPVQCPADSPVKTVPFGETCPAAPKVTDAIGATFNSNLGSFTATVTNSSALSAKCTYDATGLADTHRDFTVPPKGSTPLKFNGFNTGTSYHVVINCTDASGKQSEPIGHVDQDVTF